MAELIRLSEDFWKIGDLNALQQRMPGSIRRVFYIYDVGEMQRAGHRHVQTWHAMTCIQGSCRVASTDGISEQEFWLSGPRDCLIISPEDWHIMDNFTEGTILLVFSNQPYDPDDYVYQKPASNTAIEA